MLELIGEYPAVLSREDPISYKCIGEQARMGQTLVSTMTLVPL